MSKKPNLVYIFADQMRAMDINRAGNSDVISPNIDRLFDEGTHFDTCVSCFPVCTPHRACLISGQYPTTTGVLVNDVALPITGNGFGHALRNEGYNTAWIGKWHLFGNEPLRGKFIPPGEHRHGFDTFIGVNCSHQYFDGYYYKNDNPERIRFSGYEPDVQTDLAIEFMEQNRAEPFSLFLSFGPPHDPFYDVPQKYKDMYNTGDLRYRENVNCNEPLFDDRAPGDHPNPEGVSVYTMHVPYGTDAERRKYPHVEVLRDYYAAITALDYNIGRITDKLRELGIEDDTVVVFTSDHGEMMYSQGLVQKNHPYDESILVPFVARYPGKIKAGGACDAPFNTVDIMPTILDIMDADVPAYCEGVSFAPAMSGAAQELPDSAYIMCAWEWAVPEWRGIRSKQYTYIETLQGPYAMYDNIADPFQRDNLIGRAEHSVVQAQLQQEYLRHREKIGDPFDSWETINDNLQKKREEFAQRYPELFL